jgi:6-phosphogluconolactonase
MNQQNKIQVFQTAEELTEATAVFILTAAKHAVDARGRFVISLSGGHTPEQLYALLAKPPFHDEMPWCQTFVFWGDERCVPSTDKQNNANMARTLLLDHIDIPPSNVHPIPVDLPPLEAAKEYEQAIRNLFGEQAPRFDLILLGLGENGHTASLFPNTDVLSEHSHIVKEVHVAELKMFRITMTADLINQAHNIMFLVEGEGKAEILKTVLSDAYLPEKYPAQLIKPINGNLYWFIDHTAAMLLNDADHL